MAVVLYQRKNGFPSLWHLSMKVRAWSVTSSSIVSIRFLVSGPVSSILCPPLPSAQAVQHAPRSEVLLECRVFRVVRVFRFLFGIQVIEIAEELIEAMHGGKEFVLVPQVVLAELARGVTKRLQQLGDGRDLPRGGRHRRQACQPWSGQCGLGSAR